MTVLRIILTLLLALGPCLSQLTTEGYVTSGTTSPDVNNTGTQGMTRMSGNSSYEASGTTISATAQTATGTSVALDNASSTGNSFVTAATERYNFTTEEDNGNATSIYSATVATVVRNENTTDNNATTDFSESTSNRTTQSFTSADSISEESDNGSRSINSSTSNDVTRGTYTTSYYTEGSATALPSTINLKGNTTNEDVTTSDVSETNTTLYDVTASQVNTSDVTMTPQPESTALPADRQPPMTQYTTTDIIIIVVVTVVGGLIIISALVAVIWRLRLYRKLTRYFRSNGHAQEFSMVAAADGKKPIETESEVGALAVEDYQPPDSNYTLELVVEKPGPDNQPLFTKPDPASDCQVHPAPMVVIPLNDGIRNQGFQGENASGF